MAGLFELNLLSFREEVEEEQVSTTRIKLKISHYVCSQSPQVLIEGLLQSCRTASQFSFGNLHLISHKNCPWKIVCSGVHPFMSFILSIICQMHHMYVLCISSGEMKFHQTCSNSCPYGASSGQRRPDRDGLLVVFMWCWVWIFRICHSSSSLYGLVCLSGWTWRLQAERGEVKHRLLASLVKQVHKPRTQKMTVLCDSDKDEADSDSQTQEANSQHNFFS